MVESMSSSNYCYKVQSIRSKGAVLIIWVYIGIYFYWYFFPGIYIDHTGSYFSSVVMTLPLVTFILCLPLSVLSDLKIGRYKAILYSVCFLLISAVLLTASVITGYYYNGSYLSQFFYYTAECIASISLVSLFCNGLPFITDQMIGSSADELSAAVQWYYWGILLSRSSALIEPCLYDDDHKNIIVVIIIGFIGLTLAASSLFLGHHWLDKTHQYTNPIKLIFKVLNFARKHKYPINRSSLTYWEQDSPSRINLGMRKYGGPFTEEEVDNVKTALGLIVFAFLSTCVTSISNPLSVFQLQHMVVKDRVLTCFFRNELVIQGLEATIGVPLYHLILKPVLHKLFRRCKMTMLKLEGVGFVLTVIGIIGMMIIETVGHSQSPQATCMFNTTGEQHTMSLHYYWAIIPLLLKCTGLFVTTIVALEFAIAQAPKDMKGLIISVWFFFTGAISLIYNNLYHLFIFSAFPSCGFYYYLTQFILTTIALMVFVVISKRYKLRTREDPINFHIIAETHIEAYITQRQNYNETENIFT